jgi:hypothetical protein
VLFDQLTNSVDLFSAKAATAFESNRVQSEFRFAFVAFDANVRRLTFTTGIEEKPQRAYAKESRHVDMLHRPAREKHFQSKGCSRQ